MGSLLGDILFVETRNNARLSLEPRGGERRGVGGGAPDGMIPLSHALTHSKLRRACFRMLQMPSYVHAFDERLTKFASEILTD